MFGKSLVALALIILSNIIVLSLICLVGIRFAKINKLNIIYMRQYFISMLSTVIIGCFLLTIIATVLFLALFFLFREVIFKNDALEIQRIYALYNGDVHLCQPVLSFFQFFSTIKTEISEQLNKDYLYSFSQYLNNSVYIFIFYVLKGTILSENAILYAIEFFIAMTLLFIVIGKLVYNLALTAPNSLFFLSPTLAYIPVVLTGIVFYVIVAIIFVSAL